MSLQLTILGKPPSENHMWHKGTNRYGATINIYKPEAQAWFDAARITARMAAKHARWKHPPRGKWIAMKIWYVFENGNHPDPSNTLKCILDALEGELYQNDKYVLPQVMGVRYDKNNPRVEIQIEVMEAV